MANKRDRTRLPLSGTGHGESVETGQNFSFATQDFSVAGMQIMLLDGQTPGLGETVRLALTVEDLAGEDQPVTVIGTVRRIETHGEVPLCGVKVTAVEDSHGGDALDQAYLERYFDEFG